MMASISYPECEARLTLCELRAAMSARGLAFSDSQLKRLRREGLVMVEGQRHRRGVRGSESLYPGWTVGQLELVARLQAQERRFAQLRVLVRWHGGWVRSEELRASLIGLLDAVSAQARRMTANTVDETDRADRLAQAMRRSPGRSGVTRLMRRRLNNVADDIERAAYAFAALATGSPLEWENYNPDEPTEPLLNVLERASGFDRARHDEIAGNGPLMGAHESTQALLGELQQTGLFDILELGAAFEAASDEAIEQAFDDAVAFAGLHGTFEAIQALLGDDIAGLGSVTELSAAHEALELAALVRGLLLMRPLMSESALESIVEAARQAGPQLQAAHELARALPHLTPFLGPDGPGRLDALSDEQRKQVTGEVRDYLANRPELVAVLAEP